MAILGPRFCVDLALPSGIDASHILGFAMRNGKTAQEIVGEAAAIIGVVNERLAARYGGLWYETQLDHAIYRNGVGTGSRRTPHKVEGKQAVPIRGDITGHMLPLLDFEDAVAWTPLYLRDAWDAQIDADLHEISDSWENEVDATVLTRLLSNAEVAIGSGYSVPFAIGTGVNLPYLPPQWGSTSFDSTHTHYKYIDGAINAANVAAGLELGITELRHHGHTGRLFAMVSDTDLALYTAIPGKKFGTMVAPGMQVVAGNANAPTMVVTGELQGVPGEIFGYYLSDRGMVELRSHPRIPTGYQFVGKSYGMNNPNNPLALREHPTVGFGMRPDPQVTQSLMPELDKVLFKATYGIGVGNDRTNGVAVMVAPGATEYVAPTIS